MKHIIIKCIGLFITIIFVVSNSAMSQSELVNNQTTLVLKDSIKLLVLNKGSRKITICEGSIIKVKVNENKFSGVLSILNDSIIKIETRSIQLKDIVTTSFNEVTNNNTIRGSATGWAIHERVEMIKRTKIKLDNILNVKRRFRGIIKALVLINKTYFDHLKIYYAPGSPGMTEAYSDFIEKGGSLIIA